MTTPDSAPPTPVDWRNLIQAGRDLLNPQQLGRLPTDEHVRRAVSNIYYALFHALAESNASALIGSPHDALTAIAWSRVYRGLDHTTARRELLRHRQEFSVQARDFADAFADMQQFRHTADYDHNAVIPINQVSARLDDTEGTILNYLQAALSERIYIATLTLIRPR
ncbi:MAG: hypothetical protein OXI54_07800 [Chloroflexota bacterium]|nr:hypothetical protein [Chloroflexota bacterium]MDE2684037.1 hypothetical protein [Chloroflexota bacterium]